VLPSEVHDSLLVAAGEAYTVRPELIIGGEPRRTTARVADCRAAIAWALAECGYSQVDIGHELRLDHSTVHRYLEQATRRQSITTDPVFIQAVGRCLAVLRAENLYTQALRDRLAGVRRFAGAVASLATQVRTIADLVAHEADALDRQALAFLEAMETTRATPAPTTRATRLHAVPVDGEAVRA